jgi:hypothetical protein
VTAIAIGIVVVVIPIGAAATTNATIRTRCCCRSVWARIGGIVADDDAVAADALVAPPLPPSDVTDPTATVTMKTRDDTTSAAAMAMAMAAAATEEEDYDGCGIPNPQCRLDDALLHHVDRILLSSIAVTTGTPRRQRRRRGVRRWAFTVDRCSLGGRIGRAKAAAASRRRTKTARTWKRGSTRTISWRSCSANFGWGVSGGGRRRSALGVSREIHRRRPPPPPMEDETVVVRRRFNVARGKDNSDNGTGDT